LLNNRSDGKAACKTVQMEGETIMFARIATCVLVTASTYAADGLHDATAGITAPEITRKAEGRHVVQDVTLATSLANYQLRYDIIELDDDPEHVGFQKWAPTIGYTPLGLAGPSDANWYNQGFFTWTFDGFNIKDYKATVRIVRESGQDAMVEYVWDTPKVKAVARFAVTSQSDKLLFFGRYEPKTDIGEVKLRLMAYPSTFEKPWVRAMTTANRTLTEGAADIDPSAERWLLLEDIHPGRPGSGPAGLLFGDPTAFASVNVSGIGGYAEYVDLLLNPNRRDFALGLYEFPSLTDNELVRAYFRRLGDAESDALAKLAAADLDKPLAPLPTDKEHVARAIQADKESLQRPAECWRANPEPLDFPWASQIAGPPVNVAILACRWAAFDTMELARRLEMDVQHQFFDTKMAIVSPGVWHYRNQTGIGALNGSLAMRNATRICTDQSRDVILVGDLAADALGQGLMTAILAQVKEGKGLVLTGRGDVLNGWPEELTATPDDALAQPALSAIPWKSIPSLANLPNPPLQGYRYGKGRVLVFKAGISRYHSILPQNKALSGLDGADDRILAFHARVFLAAAGRDALGQVAFGTPQNPPQAGKPIALPFTTTASTDWHTALVRVQDDHDTVVALGEDFCDKAASVLRLPPLPATRKHYVDVLLRNKDGDCMGFASTTVEAVPSYTIEAVALSPSEQPPEVLVPAVELPDGGTVTCRATVAPPPGDANVALAWQVRDCFDRLMAKGTAPVAKNGAVTFEAKLNHPVTVAHRLELTLKSGDAPIAVKRVPFTMPIPYPYDDFTILMWSYPGGELPVRIENRLCYDLGSDMMDLCHMRGYNDAGAAREYAIAAASGQRIIPYVTRIAGTEREDHSLDPGMFNEAWVENERASMEISCRQAAPYAPPAYTLGDENYLGRGAHEVEVSPESVAAFRAWLKERYGNIGALNADWRTAHVSFDAIETPMLLDEAVQQTETFAPWLDFRDFMDTAFADLHERMAGFIRKEDPGAKVGWDGFLSYRWSSGYDFYKLSRNLELNQIYTTSSLQGELVRSFKRPDALTGEWFNSVADKEDGFTAIAWHNLFRGHNSCWWWTSWGCDYIPFNPDMSVSKMGEWYFTEANKVKAGPGRLLIHANRDNSGVAILYSQADHFAWELASRMPGAWDSGLNWISNLTGATHLFEDLGCQYQFVDEDQIETDPALLDDYRLLVLPYASCLSDRHLQAIYEFLRRGGRVIADGRACILTGNGGIRKDRPLDGLLGVQGKAGRDAFAQAPGKCTVPFGDESVELPVLEPDIELTTGKGTLSAENVPLFVVDADKRQGALLNTPFAVFNRLRTLGQEQLLLKPVAQFLATADVAPLATFTTENGPARSIEQTLFVDGNMRYLALQQDILRRDLDEQSGVLKVNEPAFVYDMMAGILVSEKPTDSWQVMVSRGRPQLFAMLPYKVASLQCNAPKSAKSGDTVPVRVSLKTESGQQPGYHVVRLDVFAPGSDTPHRQYSQNLDCPVGVGEGTFPFALSDSWGAWRLRFKDTATGTTAEAEVGVSP
jgi:Beta-galactosidase